MGGLSGCAGTREVRVAQPGDRVGVHFVCRTAEGEIASSTYKSVADDHSLKKASRFLPANSDDPLVLVAGKEEGQQSGAARAIGYEGAIARVLGGEIVGMEEGSRHTVDVSWNREEKSGGTISMARVRVRPREMRMTPEEFTKGTGKKAEMDVPFVVDPAVPGKVTAVSAEEVVVTFAPAGPSVTTPFGSALVREEGDHYALELQVAPGQLVRSGALVGRITDVNERTFLVDYRDPLGGEPLQCDLTILSVEKGNTQLGKERN
ncbi:hypothetical protein GPICK_07590 [Geobacter pickeringii]|uniref:Uncharacterized protein n=2 Tax=Geobacter pickeringii TaxID=345632 RepID=A0A0B5BGQ9_9BACT|nr:hypothetical protein GPICK_07590 [Geobacter pickeringii]